MNISLGKNEKVNAPPSTARQGASTIGAQGPAMKSHKYSKTDFWGLAQKPNISDKKTGSHNNEKIALVLFLASGFAIWNMFR